MSRQRIVHPYVVWEEKQCKEIRKGLSCREHMFAITHLLPGFENLPPYRGTKYRGHRRWWTNAGK